MKWAIMFFIGVGLLIPVGVLKDVGGHQYLVGALASMSFIFDIVGGLGYLGSRNDLQD